MATCLASKCLSMLMSVLLSLYKDGNRWITVVSSRIISSFVPVPLILKFDSLRSGSLRLSLKGARSRTRVQYVESVNRATRPLDVEKGGRDGAGCREASGGGVTRRRDIGRVGGLREEWRRRR